LNAGDVLLNIHLKPTPAFGNGNNIQFTMAANPLNELADAQYNVISNALLSIDALSSNPLGIEQHGGNSNAGNCISLSNHPNPFNDYTTINYTLPAEGKIRLELRNLIGQVLMILFDGLQSGGVHSLNVVTDKLAHGIYTLEIIYSSNKTVLVKTIKVCK